MSYKIPGIPSSRAYIEEIADFWEIESLKKDYKPISKIDISRILEIELDEVEHDGIESEGEEVENRLDEVFNEITRRQRSCTPEKYPYIVNGHSIRINEEDSEEKKIYTFLLLCTRFKMNENNEFNGIDATKVFEEICADIAKNFFGNSAESLVFGTAMAGNFTDKVNNLVGRVKEGTQFRNRNNNPPTKNDDALDIVVWKDFADGNPGKLIGFGQCKTGTSWENSFRDLSPTGFCRNWLLDQPVLDPIPIIFICDTLNYELNHYSSQSEYLFLNRFRLMEYLPAQISQDVLDKIDNWLDGALDSMRNA